MLTYFATLLTNLIPMLIASKVPKTTAITGKLSPIIPTVSLTIPEIEVPIEFKIEASRNVGTNASECLFYYSN